MRTISILIGKGFNIEIWTRRGFCGHRVTSANQSGKRIELACRRWQAKKFNFTLALRSEKRARNACV